MAKYIIHIGLPKTGTKYLQSHFRRLTTVLRQRGVYYPSEWWSSANDVNHDALLKGLSDPDASSIEAIFAKYNTLGDVAILLSCEGFSAMSAGALARLKALVSHSKVEIVFFARRWSDWIPSAWQQTVKQGGSDSFPEFLVKTLRHAKNVPAINFEPTLEAFAEAFGRNSLRLLSYSTLVDRRIDIVDTFFRRILNMADGFQVQSGVVHESTGIFVAEMIRVLNSLERQAGGEPDVHVFQRFETHRRHRAVASDIAGLLTAMQPYVTELPFDDVDGPLGPLYRHLDSMYSDHVIDVGFGSSIFEPRSTVLRFVNQDYLLASGVAEAIAQLHGDLVKLEAATARGERVTRLRERRVGPERLLDLVVAEGDQVKEYLLEHTTRPNAKILGEIDFASDVNDRILPTVGWSNPEPSFRWTNGHHSSLRLSKLTEAGDYRLLLVVRPFVAEPELTSQHVKVSVNGAAVGAADVSTYSLLECVLSWTTPPPGETITVDLELPDAACPAELRRGRDQRQLGLCLERAVLYSQTASR